jgi:hypothetical protein
VGRVETQIALARLLRNARPGRVLLELADEKHLPALQRALAEWPLGARVDFGGVLSLPKDSVIALETLSAKRGYDEGQPAKNEG